MRNSSHLKEFFNDSRIVSEACCNPAGPFVHQLAYICTGLSFTEGLFGPAQDNPGLPCTPISCVSSFLADLRYAALSEIRAGIESLTALPGGRRQCLHCNPKSRSRECTLFFFSRIHLLKVS